MFVVVVSPYELVARSDSAEAALLIADAVVTLLPAPLEGSDQHLLQEAATDAPGFGRLIRALAWTGPLWRAGVLLPTWEGAAPLGQVQAAAREMAASKGALAELIGASAFEDTHAYLQAISRDLLAGGRDPGVAVPVASGLERFAAMHGLPLVRGEGKSLSARIESRGLKPEAQVTTAAVVGASAELLIQLRDQWGAELSALRNALTTPTDTGALQQAGDRLSQLVTDWSPHAPPGVRTIAARVSRSTAASQGLVAASIEAVLGEGGRRTRLGVESSALARPAATVVTIRALPWAIETR
jgi:hypothetical protein